MRRALLLVFLVLPGLAVAAVCGYYALIDWSSLQAAYSRFHSVASSNAGLRDVFVAYAAQDIHRTNLFADGVWTLLGVLIAGIGLHGLCIQAQKAQRVE